MRRRDFFILLLSAILFVAPVLYKARNLTFRLDSDYDTVLPILHYVVDAVRLTKKLPVWNPYIGAGISTIGDPLSFVLNPLATIPIVAFGVEQGLRMTIFLVVVFSGISMWFFLTKLEVTGWLRLWGAILYQTSGTLGARLAAGQIETFLSYSLIPLFFASTLFSPMKRINVLTTALVMTLIIFSGDFYMLWFLTIFFLITKGYYVISKQEQLTRAGLDIIVVYVLFGVLASAKLVPYIFEVLPRIERFGAIDPFAGSIPIWLSPVPFIMPFRVAFYDRPSLQRLFGFYFNWYEYYAFISPLAFLFLLKIKSLLNHKVIHLLLILLGIGALYGALKFPYSPFYWLFHFVPAVRVFRVPQRIFSPMTTLVIGLLALCAKRWRRRTIISICAVSVVWTFFVGQKTMLISFEQPRTVEAVTVHALRQKDQGNFFVVTFVCCMQTFLVEEHIPILNYYYGWRFKDVPNFETDMLQLNVMRPRYIIAPKRMDFSMYPYKKYFETDIANIWRATSETMVPLL